ncbi:uncharacterized protein LOC108680678 [Hyalella azteca]|uniref:Uncharacterized protein LOC108680678 n=1 Tax=Hyalella azteca TaxID=294128 RepID=A0A979FU63_HYAAZ|nr:uncharacterized protein LOC108680678 [Hyalella azteca]
MAAESSGIISALAVNGSTKDNYVMRVVEKENDGQVKKLIAEEKASVAIPKNKRRTVVPTRIFERSKTDSEASKCSVCCARAGSDLYRSSTVGLSNSNRFRKNIEKKRINKRSVTTRQKRHKDEFKRLVDARLCMERQRVLTFESYDDKLMNFNVYLQSFEEYCKKNFRHAPRFWICELQNKLQGDTLTAFKTLRSVNDSYESLKLKLVKWYDKHRLARKSNDRSQFVYANFIKAESMHSLATRLEKLFQVAFPCKDVNTSKTLREKFLSTLPRNLKELLKTQILDHGMSWKKIQWSDVKQLSSYCDIVKSCDYHNSNMEENNCMVNEKYNDSRIYWQCSERTSKHPSGKNSKCFHCGRMGHVEAECRSKSGACFTCGSFDHFFYNCPLYKFHHSTQSSKGCTEESSLAQKTSTSALRVVKQGGINLKQGNLQRFLSGYKFERDAWFNRYSLLEDEAEIEDEDENFENDLVSQKQLCTIKITAKKITAKKRSSVTKSKSTITSRPRYFGPRGLHQECSSEVLERSVVDKKRRPYLSKIQHSSSSRKLKSQLPEGAAHCSKLSVPYPSDMKNVQSSAMTKINLHENLSKKPEMDYFKGRGYATAKNEDATKLEHSSGNPKMQHGDENSTSSNGKLQDVRRTRVLQTEALKQQQCSRRLHRGR